jgi:dissimilatory sulfite reductase beta subunit
LACCLNMCGAVHASDIAILGIHRKPPMIDHKRITGVCELPLAIASCPLGAVKPAKAEVNGKEIKSVQVTVERCMFCGNCYTMCPAMPMADPEGDGIAILVGGKVSNPYLGTEILQAGYPFLPNTTPRWPETVEAVKKILEAYAKDAKSTSALASGQNVSVGRISLRNVICRSRRNPSMIIVWPMIPGGPPRNSSSPAI